MKLTVLNKRLNFNLSGTQLLLKEGDLFLDPHNIYMLAVDSLVPQINFNWMVFKNINLHAPRLPQYGSVQSIVLGGEFQQKRGESRLVHVSETETIFHPVKDM